MRRLGRSVSIGAFAALSAIAGWAWGAASGAQPGAGGKIPAPLEIQFSWAGIAPCSAAPPAFRIRNVPPGTESLRFTMRDLQAPDYPHGGGRVRWSGNPAIAAGAFRYNGPCPPPGTRHVYRWTVQALAASGRVLS